MSPRARMVFISMAVIWGLPYLLIKVAVEGGISPLFLAWGRFVLGASVLLPLARKPNIPYMLRGRIAWLCAFALVELIIPFPLIAFGEQRLASSVAAIIIAGTPLLAVLLALPFDASERAGGARLVGLVIGLAGVAALVGVDVIAHAHDAIGAAAILVAALCYAVGPLIFKHRLADIDTPVAMGVSLVLAAIALAPAALSQRPAGIPSTPVTLAVLGLGFVCTGLALALFGTLIAEVGASRALVFTYINPLVALALGMAILNERPGLGVVAGLPLILVGSWLATARGT